MDAKSGQLKNESKSKISSAPGHAQECASGTATNTFDVSLMVQFRVHQIISLEFYLKVHFKRSIYRFTKRCTWDCTKRCTTGCTCLCSYQSFFSIWVFFHEHSWIIGLQGKGEVISLTPHYYVHSIHRHLDVSRAITAEISLLCIAFSRNQTGNLWFPGTSQ